MNAIDIAGGPTAVANMCGVTQPSVTQWRTRGIPTDRCPAIERATSGRVTCEDMRPDVCWVRIPDPAWPHPAGRPCIDVAAPAAVTPAAAPAAPSQTQSPAGQT